MEYWLEFRAAYLVGSLGTVSAASEACGVHRATIIRYIDALERAVGSKLFHRHRKGYTPTEVGAEFMERATAIVGDYNHLLGTLQNYVFEVSGEISICSATPLSPLVLRTAKIFQESFPGCTVNYTATEQFPGLELAEANIVLWAGEQPTVDDYVVVPVMKFRNHLYASGDYLREFGNPQDESDLSKHHFVCVSPAARSGPSDWFRGYLESLEIPPPQIVFQSNCRSTVFRSIIDGSGIGVLPYHIAQSTPGMVKIMPALSVPSVQSWAVTHVDTHRTPKIQEFLKVMREVGAAAYAQHRIWEEGGRHAQNDTPPLLLAV